MKPYAESCDQNRKPILAILKEYFSEIEHVLEIGSGTGQHAIYFSQNLPHLLWQTSDKIEHHSGLLEWLQEAKNSNVLLPIELDVNHSPWPAITVDAVFSANTTHIMDWTSVEKMYAGIGLVLQTQGLFCLYGPFNYHGQFTSQSNEAFDLWLKERDPESGIREIDDLVDLARLHNLRLVHDYEMPENNRLLIWQKVKTLDLK